MWQVRAWQRETNELNSEKKIEMIISFILNITLLIGSAANSVESRGFESKIPRRLRHFHPAPIPFFFVRWTDNGNKSNTTMKSR